MTSNQIVIIGAGILGVSTAFWLSELYEASVLLVDQEQDVAVHTSSRNTGVIHRPFYMDPVKKRVFARASQKSYGMWAKLASRNNLPWNPCGTIQVALNDSQIATLETYKKWSLENGMAEDETRVIDRQGTKKLEPEVDCPAAIFCKTDTSVEYGQFTKSIFQISLKNGVRLLGSSKVLSIDRKNKKIATSNSDVEYGLLVNVAGGGAVDIAHMMGLGKNYTDLHFRGEYWIVDEPFASRVSRNVYSVAKYREFPFLDPHFITRANGTKEIGPNAVLVSDPTAYHGLSSRRLALLKKIFERPLMPKIKLFTRKKFLSLVWAEWRSSRSKSAMCNRVRQFIPSIDSKVLNKRGLAGVRSSLIDADGFVPEAVTIESDSTFHVLNYNSPGATGAPAFSAYLVKRMEDKGYLDGLRKRANRRNSDLWQFENASDL